MTETAQKHHSIQLTREEAIAMSPDLSQMIMVMVDQNTWVAMRPGGDPEAIKLKYQRKRIIWKKSQNQPLVD